jgi:putative DNA primase/helicase
MTIECFGCGRRIDREEAEFVGDLPHCPDCRPGSENGEKQPEEPGSPGANPGEDAEPSRRDAPDGVEVVEENGDVIARQQPDPETGVRTDPDEFRRFHELLISEAPEGYTPHYIKCKKGSKAPLTVSSWKQPEDRLSVEEAVAWLRDGGNIGIAGVARDTLIDLDIDDPELVDDDVKPTLRGVSRSRPRPPGGHGWYFADGEIPNIDSSAGEVRTDNQYVVAPGSHVPIVLSDPDDPDLEDIPKGDRENVGRYTIAEERTAATLEYEELPAVYREEHEERQAVVEERPDRRDEPPEPTGDGPGRSAVFDLDITDVTGLSWGYRGVNPIGHHNNDHHGNDQYFKIDRQKGARDFKDNVSYSPASWVLADAGERDPRNPNGGLTDREYFIFWKYCKERNLVADDDPIPRRALRHVAREETDWDGDLVEVTTRDGETFEGLPRDVYTAAIEGVREVYNLTPGRDARTGHDGETGGEKAAQATADGGVSTASAGTADADSLDAPEPPETMVNLTPTCVKAKAGLGEDDNISDLNSQQKAACAWQCLRGSEYLHVRARRDNGELWSYDDGIWKAEGERTLRHAGTTALGAMNYGSAVLTELKEQVRSDMSAEIEGDELGLEPGQVAVENGLLDLETAAEHKNTDAVRELTPEDYAMTRLPVEYDPSAESNEWADLVEEWAEDGRADMLQEYVGYCLHIGALPIHRALLLVGKGANGKGTFLSVVRALLGEENTSSIELQTLANEHNAVADYYGSLANIDDDLSSRQLGSGLGMFKKLTAGDRVRARRLYEEGFEFDAVGKQLYAANEVPDVDVPEDDEAFWRRWVLVEFPNHYPPSERDPELKDRFTSPARLSGVLNWAIEGWHRLLEQGHFTGEERFAQGKRERWQEWGDSIEKFVAECVERDEDASNKSTGNVHRVYSAWARQNDERNLGQQKLTMELKNEELGYSTSVRPGGTGTPTHGYKALSFTDEAPELDDTPERGRGQQRFD